MLSKIYTRTVIVNRGLEKRIRTNLGEFRVRQAARYSELHSRTNQEDETMPSEEGMLQSMLRCTIHRDFAKCYVGLDEFSPYARLHPQFR